jgi:dTDP-4-dehydrorhamnose 3,5-epimerase
MRFELTDIEGVVVVELEPRRDDRGSFARAFCASEFERNGLESHVEQANLSTSVEAGTLRGLHYQLPPAAETKLVRCVRGALFDVAVDIRPGSATFGAWFGLELTEDNGTALMIPRGCAHGFQTLAPATTALYQVSAAYDPSRERGINHSDPALGIRWPLEVSSLSPRDRQLPNLADADLP